MPGELNIKLLSNLEEISISPVFKFEFSDTHFKISQEFANFFQIFKNLSFKSSPGSKNHYKFSLGFRFRQQKSRVNICRK